MIRTLALVPLLALAACTTPVRETLPDEQAAIATAIALCSWEENAPWHAERQEKNWRIWEDENHRQAFVSRYNTSGAYLCITL